MGLISSQAISLDCIAQACEPQNNGLFIVRRPVWQKNDFFLTKNDMALTYGGKPSVEYRNKWRRLSIWKTLLAIEELMLNGKNYTALGSKSRSSLKRYLTQVQTQESWIIPSAKSFFKHGVLGNEWISTAGKAERLHARIKEIADLEKKHPVMKYWGFEEQYSDSLYDKKSPSRSHIYEVSGEGYKDLSSQHKCIGFINGIDNDFKWAEKNAKLISDYGNVKVKAVFNCTHNIFRDLWESFWGWIGYCTKPSYKLRKMWDQFFDGDRDPRARFLMVCHSQGAVLVKNALKHYNPELRKRIDVVAVAPGAYINPKYCGSVVHFRASFKRDIVPLPDFIFLTIRNFFFKLMKLEKSLADWNIRTVPSHRDSPLFDHSVRSETFVPYVREQVVGFVNKNLI